jgi:hypothetical protein
MNESTVACDGRAPTVFAAVEALGDAALVFAAGAVAGAPGFAWAMQAEDRLKPNNMIRM